MTPRTYPQGVPCWVDNEQPDLDAAQQFYGQLFGWTFTDALPPQAPGSYLVAAINGQDVAAIGPGDTVAWNTYIAVDDADAVAAAVAAAGGTIIQEPADAGEGGRMAEFADPRGARARLWQARRRPGAQRVNEHGAWNFSDLHTAAPDSATGFYASVFGWEFDDNGFATMIRRPGYGDHLAATVDPGIRERHDGFPPGFSDAIAWLVATPDEQADTWAVTFAVDDRDESAALAEKLGATVLGSDETEWTKTARVRDPQGAELTLSQFTPPD